jgi:hypothetical protein
MQGFGGETERNRPFARSRSIWEDNINKTRGVVGHPVGTKFLSLYIMYI